MNRSTIEWCDYTWNPITGCSRGCYYCYARRMAQRLKGRCGYPADDPFRVTFHPSRLLEALELKKPSKIFTVSMGEFFDPKVPDLWRDLILRVMLEAEHHKFLVLTKQPDNIPYQLEYEVPSNLWLGVSIDGKTTHAGWMLDALQSSFGWHHFVSFEPLLGPVEDVDLEGIDWVIIGAQTGPGAKQPRKEWLEPILSQTVEYDIPLFIKNNLEWVGDRPQEFPEVMT